MKHLFTFFYLLAITMGGASQAKAQRYTLTNPGSGQPPVVTIDRANSPDRPGARQPTDACGLYVSYLPNPTVCDGAGPIFNSVINWSSIDGFSTTTTLLEISDGSGDFSNASTLATGTYIGDLINVLFHTNLPFGLPYGTNYKFRLRVPAQGCLSNEVGPVTIGFPTTLTNNGPLTCAKTSVTLTASGGNSYTFVNGSGTVLGTSGATSTRSVSAPGSYSVRVANASGCTSTTSTIVTGNTTLPTATILTPASTTLTCTTTALSLTATGGGTYRWENNTTAAVRVITTAGTYSVTVTSPNGCSATDSQVISGNNTLVATAGASSSSALIGSVVSLSATGGSAYQWSAPAGASLSSPATSSAVSATLITSGLKTFTVVVSQGTCSQTLTVGVTAKLPPDLIPLLYVTPSLAYSTTTGSVVVDVFEINSTPTSGPITVHIAKSSLLSLSFNPAATSFLGHPVQNNVWSFDGTSSTNSYILTTTQVIGAGSKLSVGLSSLLTPGQTKGTISVTATLAGSSGGEVKVTNNADADQLEYFNK